MRIGGIDPAVNTVWWAYFERDRLAGPFLFTEAGLFDHVAPWTTRAHVKCMNLDSLVVEIPQVYAGKAKGDNNDLINLAIVAGACAAGCHQSVLATPRRWKGTMKKEAHHARLLSKLMLPERRLLETILARYAKGLQHNLLDAVGLAAWLCGRSK